MNTYVVEYFNGFDISKICVYACSEYQARFKARRYLRNRGIMVTFKDIKTMYIDNSKTPVIR